MLGGRWGSPAKSGPPVAERAPVTAQLFDPLASTARPIESRTRAICSARPRPSPVHASPGVRITGLPRGYPGSSRAASSAPSSRVISARKSSRSQLVERPKESSLARVSASAGTNASKPIRRSWNSAGSGRSAAAALTPAQNASSADRSSGWSAAASRSAARRRPRVRMNRSVRSPGGRRSRPAARSRSCGRGRAARGDPVRGKSPPRTTGRASVLAWMWGTPQRSRPISTACSSPSSRRRPLTLGSGLRKSWYQSPAAVVPASAVNAAPARPNRFASCRQHASTLSGAVQTLVRDALAAAGLPPPASRGGPA